MMENKELRNELEKWADLYQLIPHEYWVIKDNILYEFETVRNYLLQKAVKYNKSYEQGEKFMVKGTAVIFNEQYIEELTRHRDNWKKKAEIENTPSQKEKNIKEYEKWENKLDWALNFQDVVDSTINVEVPHITICKMLSGLEIPAKHLQTI